MSEKNCRTCGYKRNIPGDAHIRCVFDWTGQETPMPRGAECGVKKGWFCFPFNYDPVWMIGACSVWSEKVDPEKINNADPMSNLMTMMGKIF